MPTTTFAVECHGVTDRGRQRDTNQDHFAVAELHASGLRLLQTNLPDRQLVGSVEEPPGWLLLVADGMGGHAGGGRASALALEVLLESFPAALAESPDSWRDGGELVLRALEQALARVEERVSAAAAEEAPEMGTTLTAACLIAGRLHLAHVGDSRCYRLSEGRLRQLTRDDTVAQMMVEQGVLGEEQAAQSRWEHVLHNSVGGGGEMRRPQTAGVDVAADDVLLLCSDGLTKHLDDEAIGRELGAAGSSADRARRLVALANERGGSDNVTAIVVRIG